MFAAEIRAIFTLISIGLRYIIVKLFWPLFKPSPRKKTVLYFNGEIIGHNGPAEAVVTEGQTISYIGPLQKAKEYVANQNGVEFVDLQGQTMGPGFIDPHLHPSMAAFLLTMEFITPFDWSFPWLKAKGVRTEAEYRQKLTELCQRPIEKNDEWLFTWGYHSLFHGKIDKAILDSLCPNRPLVVWHRSFHAVHLNSKALLGCKLDKSVCDSDPQVSWEQGHFYEKGLERLLAGSHVILLKILPKLENGYEKVTKVIEAGGITTVADLEYPMFNETLEHVMATLKLSKGSQPFLTLAVPSSRVLGQKFKGQHSKAIDYIRKQSSVWSLKEGNFRLFADHVKVIVDGAFFSLNMQMNEPFLDGSEGQWMIIPEEIEKVMEAYWKANFQIHLHTNGDKAMDLVLGNIRRLQEKFPRKDHKTTIEHAGYFTMDQADQLASLGCFVSAQPYYYYALKDVYSEHGLGPERAKQISALKMLTDRQIPLALHSDFTMAPAQPLFQMWVAINRTTVNGSKSEDLGISIKDAFEAVTINAAKILGLDEQMGSIEIGKMANFVILDKNPFKMDTCQLKDIRVMKTIFRGQY